MRSHRLDRLARLTQGVALVGIGITGVACGEPRVNSPRPEEQPHINAPPEKPVAPAAIDAGSAVAPPAEIPPPATVNSAPRPPVHTNSMPRTK